MTGAEASSQNCSFPMEAQHAFGITLERRGRDFRSSLSLSSRREPDILHPCPPGRAGRGLHRTEFVANGACAAAGIRPHPPFRADGHALGNRQSAESRPTGLGTRNALAIANRVHACSPVRRSGRITFLRKGVVARVPELQPGTLQRVAVRRLPILVITSFIESAARQKNKWATLALRLTNPESAAVADVPGARSRQSRSRRHRS
jgi:hypothetical protein